MIQHQWPDGCKMAVNGTDGLDHACFPYIIQTQHTSGFAFAEIAGKATPKKSPAKATPKKSPAKATPKKSPAKATPQNKPGQEVACQS